MRKPIKIDKHGRETISRSSTLSVEAYYVRTFLLKTIFLFLACYLCLILCGTSETNQLAFWIPLALSVIYAVLDACCNRDSNLESATFDYDERAVAFKCARILGPSYEVKVPFDRLIVLEKKTSDHITRFSNDRYLIYDENDEKLTWVPGAHGWKNKDTVQLMPALGAFPHGKYADLFRYTYSNNEIKQQ